MTDSPKPGRPKSPCYKCGWSERNANGNCVPGHRAYMQEYRKRWVAKRRAAMKAESSN